MFKPYRKIAEDERTITYQYNTLLSWLTVVVIIACFIGIFLDHTMIIVHTSIISIALLSCKHGLDRDTSRRIKDDMRQQRIEKSGKPYSFKNPMLMTISKAI